MRKKIITVGYPNEVEDVPTPASKHSKFGAVIVRVWV